MAFRSNSLNGYTPSANPAEYHAIGGTKGTPDFVMSRSELVAFDECPHKWLKNNEPKRATKAMDFGGLVDCLVTSPGHFSEQFAIQPLSYTTERLVCPGCGSQSTTAKKCSKCKRDRENQVVTLDWEPRSEHCQKWMSDQEAAGRTVVTREQMTSAEAARDSLFEAKKGWMRNVIENADLQVQLLLEYADDDHDNATGLVIPFKALLDIVPWPESNHPDLVVDLKVTRDARTDKWSRTVYADKLYMQAPLYVDALNAVTGLAYRKFCHFVIESNGSFEATHHALGSDFMMVGRAEYINAMRRYCQCLKSGDWPGYDTTEIEPEKWMFRE